MSYPLAEKEHQNSQVCLGLNFKLYTDRAYTSQPFKTKISNLSRKNYE